MPLKQGDIVRCKTNRSHKWAISEFIGMADGRFTCPVYLVREIGGKDECQIANESLDVLRFMPESQLYTGKKKQLYDWAYKAFLPQHNKDADKYRVRCGGVFVKENTVEIWARPHIFGLERRIEDKAEYAQPVKYIIPWNSKTRLKDIISEMWTQGFPPEWEWSQTQPTEGMGGCATFTRDDVARMLGRAIM